ncbi:hypothetical protein [Psychroserpens algicola]|uniref:hypothetical protein n=1 Tax=Psychroserpens algicola TaxID=1719034 RepID=UPI0019531DC1|nr:hypothetical protein [Psychroserpens algicola]
MKKLLFIICLSVYSLSASAQTKSLKKSIQTLNTYLTVYDSLRSHGEHYYTPKFLKLTREDLIKEFDEPVKITDSLGNFDAIGIIQSKIEESLKQVLAHKKAVTLDLTTAFNDNLAVVKSDDNKLYNFSIDGKAGGSYQFRESWMFYLNEDHFIESRVYDVWKAREQQDPAVFEGNGYNDIRSFTHSGTTYYVLIGNVRTCGACYVDYVSLVHFETKDFVLDFEYTIDSRFYDQKIFFDKASKSLSVFYITDDLSEDCFCSNEEYNTYWTGGTSNDGERDADGQLKPKSCSCLFEFNGKTFKLSKRCMEIMNEDD